MHRAFHIPARLAGPAAGGRLQGSSPPSGPLRVGGRHAGATAAAAGPAPKPAPAPRKPAKPDASADAARFDPIRAGLRRLVVAEENYYAENGIYTEDLARIGFHVQGDTQVRFLWLSRAGWAVRGTRPGLTSEDCVVYVGREHEPPATTRYARTGKEGVPVCDDKRAPRPAPAAQAPVAQEPAPAPTAPDTSSALEEVTSNVQMRVDLRNLVRAQESYKGNQGVYSRRMEPFALQFLWRRGVGITILDADDASWSAMATHASRPGKSCVVWFGPVPKKPATLSQKRVPEEEGTPVCDD